MEKFKLEIYIDNENVWMRSGFSLGSIVKHIGAEISRKSFQDMIKNRTDIKDIQGNVVGYYEVSP